MQHATKRTAGTVKALAGCAAVALYVLAAPRDAACALNKVEVRLVELAHVDAQPGVRMRLTLANGQGVEYKVDEPREVDTVLRMVDMFLSGRTRMFAELDGDSVVRALQVAGPVGFRPVQ